MYPKENEWLFHKILLSGGCVISEYPPDVEPNTRNFPKRNRIISGIAKAVLVVEAEFRSGSTITANYAKEQGKMVYAIPNNIYVSTGVGTNKLIQNGATLITKSSQIQKDFIPKTSKKLNQKQSLKSIDINFEIPNEYREINILLKKGPMHINEIAKKQNLSISELNSVMTLMEIEGYIERLDFNVYKRKG